MYVTKEKHVFCAAKKLALAAALSLFVMHPNSAIADGEYPAKTLDTYGTDYSMSSSYEWVNPSSADPDRIINIPTSNDNTINVPTYDAQTGIITNNYYSLQKLEDVTNNSQYVWENTDAIGRNLVGHHLDFHFIRTNNQNNAFGAGIYNNPTPANDYVSSVVGDFINNTCEVYGTNHNHFSHGGGVDNHGVMNYVYGDYIGNSIYVQKYNPLTNNNIGVDGAGLRNGKEVGSIVGNFIGNEADAGNDTEAFGGGIGNNMSHNDTTATSARIGNIKGSFIGNSAKTGGGGIYNNNATIDNIKANFLLNQSGYTNKTTDRVGQQTSAQGSGGGIYNSSQGTISSIEGDFVANSATKHGGAIYNTDRSTINNINGNFIGNTAVNGGAIYNNNGGTIGSIVINDRIYDTLPTNGQVGENVGNYVLQDDNTYKRISKINTENIVSYEQSGGNDKTYSQNDLDNLPSYEIYQEGAELQTGKFVEVEDGVFKRISAIEEVKHFVYYGDPAVDENGNPIISDGVTGTFIANKAENGGAIYNTDSSSIRANANFVSNESTGNGGAIYNDSKLADSGVVVIDGNFINNKAEGNGGAIYNAGDMELLADGHRNVIRSNAGANSEGIYMEGVAPQTHQTDEYTLDQMQAALNEPGSTYIAENFIETPQQSGIYRYQIGGTEQEPEWEVRTVVDVPAQIPTLTFNTPTNGEWVIYDKITGNLGEGNDPKANAYYDVNMIGGGTVSLFNDIEGGNTTLDSTTLNTINNEVHVYDMNEFTVKGNSNMTVDFDIKNERMDRITTADPNSNFAGNTGTLDVKLNFLNDTDKNKASVLFAEPELAHNVLNHGKAEGETYRIVNPIRMYDIQYNVHNDDNRGYFEFSSNWNPSVLAAPVVLQTGIQSAMNTDIQYAFNHLDTYTKIPKFDRLTLMNNQNKYAFASTDYNENSALRLYNLKENRTSNNGVWLRPYAAFERVPLKNGPKVDSITYGTFLGYDSNFREHKHGWHSVWSTYLGYQGGEIEFKDVRANLNGGVIGLTDTFYKNNFWTALLITGGAMNADISTMYGHEDSMSIAGAIASKTGYNFEFKDGRYIIQPIFKASYTMSKMLDYTNAAGVRIDAKPLHTIQINPSLRFIMNCKNGWQPYARVGMVWNLLNDTNVYAGGYHLPEMHIKPYIEYGLGVQKLYKHRFTGFGQAMVRNGGRNGIAITLGFRYAIGRDNDKDYNNMTRWEKFKSFFVE